MKSDLFTFFRPLANFWQKAEEALEHLRSKFHFQLFLIRCFRKSCIFQKCHPFASTTLNYSQTYRIIEKTAEKKTFLHVAPTGQTLASQRGGKKEP